MRQYCDDPFDKFHSVHIFVCKNGKGNKPVLLNVDVVNENTNTTQWSDADAFQTSATRQEKKVRTRHVVSNRLWISGRCCCCDQTSPIRQKCSVGRSFKTEEHEANDWRLVLRSLPPRKKIIHEVNYILNYVVWYFFLK